MFTHLQIIRIGQFGKMILKGEKKFASFSKMKKFHWDNKKDKDYY